MTNIDTLVDPGRTLPAGRLNGLVHIIRSSKRVDKYLAYCGLAIERKDLMVFAQRPEDITCRECQAKYVQNS